MTSQTIRGDRNATEDCHLSSRFLHSVRGASINTKIKVPRDLNLHRCSHANKANCTSFPSLYLRLLRRCHVHRRPTINKEDAANVEKKPPSVIEILNEPSNPGATGYFMVNQGTMLTITNLSGGFLEWDEYSDQQRSSISEFLTQWALRREPRGNQFLRCFVRVQSNSYRAYNRFGEAEKGLMQKGSCRKV